MLNQMVIFISILHIAWSEVVDTAVECSEDELDKMQDEFNQCALRFGLEFEDTRHVFTKQIYLEVYLYIYRGCSSIT